MANEKDLKKLDVGGMEKVDGGKVIMIPGAIVFNDDGTRTSVSIFQVYDASGRMVLQTTNASEAHRVNVSINRAADITAAMHADRNAGAQIEAHLDAPVNYSSRNPFYSIGVDNND